MQPQILVVSDPPHGEVDLEAVSTTLGLDAETAQLKVAFPAPEVLAATGPQKAHELAHELAGAGLRSRVVGGHEIENVPWPRLASSLSFGPDALQARVGDETVAVPYSSSVWCVSCRPPDSFSREAAVSIDHAMSSRGGPAVAEALEWSHHLDLFATTGDGVERLCLVGEPDAMLEEVERRFHRVGVDRRLDGIRPRQRFVAGDTGFDIDLRKAFSFGTLLLRHVLQSISEDLRDLPQYEFAARLSFATRPQADAP